MRKSDLTYKTFIVPVAIIIILGTGASSVEAFSKRKQDKPDLTEDQRNTLSEAKQLFDSGDERAAKLLLVEAGFGQVLNYGKIVNRKDRDLMREAVRTKDYEAFVVAAKGGPFAGEITKEVFERLAEAHTLSINGQKIEAREIRKELGLAKKSNRANKHNERRVKFTTEEQAIIKSFAGDRDKVKSYLRELKSNK